MEKVTIEELKINLKEISDILYSGETTKGMADMGLVIPDLAILANSIDDDELNGRLLNDVLVPALEAMESKDGLLLADVINYELMNILEEI